MIAVRVQFQLLAIVASAFIVARPVHADEPAASPIPASAEPSDEFQDSAFERFVDIRLIGPAIMERDAGLLADVALQLAESERVLRRQHKSGVTAKSLLAKAALLAADKQDKATLERLTRVASTLGNKELSAQLAALEKAGGVSRAADPALTVSLDAVTIETVVRLKGILDAIKQAELIGDGEWLDAVERKLKDAPDITDAQTTALAKLIENARDGMPAEGTGEIDPVAKLAGASRQHWIKRPQDWMSKGPIIFKPQNDGGYTSGWETEAWMEQNAKNNVQVDSDVKTRFTYTLWNGCSEAVVRVRLPGNKTDQLYPGDKKSYVFAGSRTDARIYVYNSKKEYSLRPGNHKFWWMREGRVGFDKDAF